MTHSCVYDVGNGGIGANAGTVVGVVDVDAGTVVGNAVSAAFGITHANTLHSHI
jgi:pyrimidine deaminase RibD-like protein